MQKVFIISGPSRVGKNAVIQGLLEIPNLNLAKVITATSRAQRLSEVNGKDYYFLSKEEFEKKITAGYFLEWAVLRGGRYFGTPIDGINKILQTGKNVIMTIDVQGATQVRQKRSDVISIFIKPDSLKSLKQRMDKAGFTEEERKNRLEDYKRELDEEKHYDYSVINYEGKLDETIKEVADIIRKGLRNKA